MNEEIADDDRRRIKLVIVGDGAVGKTCLLQTFATGIFPAEYTPTVFENQIVEREYEGEQILVQLWDTAGQEDYDRLRPLSYPGSDVVLICYSTVNEGSYEAIEEKWLPEVQEYIEEAPIVLVGTKSDLREANLPDIVEDEFSPVSEEDGRTLANDIDAKAFVETSAKTGHNLESLFHQAIALALRFKYEQQGATPQSPPPAAKKPTDPPAETTASKDKDKEKEKEKEKENKEESAPSKEKEKEKKRGSRIREKMEKRASRKEKKEKEKDTSKKEGDKTKKGTGEEEKTKKKKWWNR